MLDKASNASMLLRCMCVQRVRSVRACDKGDTLAIDGSGWMFQLLQGQRVDHGGDYDLLHKTVVREVARLRQVSARAGGEGLWDH